MKRPLLLIALIPAAARAALSGPPLTDNDYRVDVGHGVAVGTNRQVSMGGADAALAHGAASLSNNPAAAAVRLPGAPERLWDWDAALESFLVGGRDFDNNGSRSSAYKAHRVTSLGALFQAGKWGGGFILHSQRYDVATGGVDRRFDFSTEHLVIGRTAYDRQLAWGAGFRVAELKLTPTGSSQSLLRLSGGSVSAGLLWNPRSGPWRYGFAHTTAVKEDPDRAPAGAGVSMAGGLIVPKAVTLPPVTSIGVAAILPGARPWTLAADLQRIGRAEESVGIESFLEQRVQRSGDRATWSPRVGAEWEVVRGRLRVRGGSYFEPARFRGVSGRWHGTGGFEARLFKMRLFGGRALSLSYAADAAPRIHAQFLSLGFWH